TAQSSRQRLNFLQRYRGALDHYLSFAADAGIPPAPLYAPVLIWKGALATRQAEQRLARDRPDLQPLVKQLRHARAGLARLAKQMGGRPHQPTGSTAALSGPESKVRGGPPTRGGGGGPPPPGVARSGAGRGPPGGPPRSPRPRLSPAPGFPATGRPPPPRRA